MRDTERKFDKSTEPMDLLISFDTTGSMYPVLANVRREVAAFVKDMFGYIGDLRVGIIAHGDYCDKDHPYTIRIMDFTTDMAEIIKFVETTDKTYGGDADECYELVLNSARKQMAWRDEASKVFVLIGDASPHGINYPDNKDKLDWRIEAKHIGNMGVQVYAVHALSHYRCSSRGFYQTVADYTNGTYLTLDQFDEVVKLIKATCLNKFSEEKLDEYVSIIRENGQMTRTMDANIRRLKREKVEDVYDAPYRSSRKSTTSKKTVERILPSEGLVPVNPGRFQTMTVDSNCDIRGFVEKNGIEFEKGRGFYELTKAETVQQYKEIIIQDRETGEMFNGSQVREKLGLQPQTASGGAHEHLSSKDTKAFRVFVQSTSYNRKLIGGTTFLYEIKDLVDSGTKIEDSVVDTKKDTIESVESPVISDETKVESPVTEATTVTDVKHTKKSVKTSKKEKTTMKKETKTNKKTKTTKDAVTTDAAEAAAAAEKAKESATAVEIKPVKSEKAAKAPTTKTVLRYAKELSAAADVLATAMKSGEGVEEAKAAAQKAATKFTNYVAKV